MKNAFFFFIVAVSFLVNSIEGSSSSKETINFGEGGVVEKEALLESLVLQAETDEKARNAVKDLFIRAMAIRSHHKSHSQKRDHFMSVAEALLPFVSEEDLGEILQRYDEGKISSSSPPPSSSSSRLSLSPFPVSELVLEQADLVYQDGMEAKEMGNWHEATMSFSTASRLVGYRNLTYEVERGNSLNASRQYSIDNNIYHEVDVACANKTFHLKWFHGEPWLPVAIRAGLDKFAGCINGAHAINGIEEAACTSSENALSSEQEEEEEEEDSNDEDDIKNNKKKLGKSKALLPWIRAPRHMPDALWFDYTLNGSIPVEDFYIDDAGHGKPFSTGVTHDINYHLESVRQRVQGGCPYGTVLELYRVLDSNRPDITLRNKRVVVVGSAAPWMEAIAIEYGASEIVTVDYVKADYNHPLIRFLSVSEFNELFSAGKIKPFDVAVSISSLEHDGLGRYGDPLNPIADLQAIEQLRSYLVPNEGLLFFSVPSGPDQLYWNAHRQYGPIRLPLMLQNFQVLHGIHKVSDRAWFSHDEPLFVLKNKRPTENWIIE